MKGSLIRAILLAISVVLWLVLLGYHLVMSVVDTHPILVLPITVGDLGYRLVLAAFLLSTALFFEQLFVNIEKLEVTTLLWRQFITGMGGIAVVMLVTFANRASASWVAPGIHRYLQAVYISLALYAMVLFFLSAVFIFRRFILYPRTRRKIITWRIFLGFLALGLLFQIQPMGLYVVPVSYLLLIALCLVLSANVRWIAYLNFNQKLRALGLFALLALVIVTFLIAALQLPRQLGFPLDNILRLDFINFIICFTISYTLISILVLFFNLPTSSLFEKESMEIVSFTKINQAIQSNLDFTDLTNSLLNASLMLSNARAGWVEMFEGEAGTPQIKLTNRIAPEEVQDMSERADYAERIRKDRKPLLIRNLRKQKGNGELASRYRSLLGVPIISSSKAYGIVYLVSELSNAFEDEAVKSIRSYAEQTGIALENARLINESIEVERYQEQLKIARSVQRELLPQTLPQSATVQFGARGDTAHEVGGDYFDVVVPGPGRYRVAIGDVSGKGTTAAFYMAETKGIFHALARLDLRPLEFVAIANQALSECMQRGFFMTLTYLQIDEDHRRLELVRAGHCPALYYHAAEQRIEELREGTLGLGIVRSPAYANYLKTSTVRHYQPGDMLVLYTDGINEARNEAGEEFGYDRLRELVAAHVDQQPDALAELLVNSVKDFAHGDLHDDYTVLIIKFQ